VTGQIEIAGYTTVGMMPDPMTAATSAEYWLLSIIPCDKPNCSPLRTGPVWEATDVSTFGDFGAKSGFQTGNKFAAGRAPSYLVEIGSRTHK
jgi:hypothetical protein